MQPGRIPGAAPAPFSETALFCIFLERRPRQALRGRQFHPLPDHLEEGGEGSKHFDRDSTISTSGQLPRLSRCLVCVDRRGLVSRDTRIPGNWNSHRRGHWGLSSPVRRLRRRSVHHPVVHGCVVSHRHAVRRTALSRQPGHQSRTQRRTDPDCRHAACDDRRAFGAVVAGSRAARACGSVSCDSSGECRAGVADCPRFP